MNHKNQDLLIISLVILLSVLAWIVVEIHHIKTTTKYQVDYQRSMRVIIKKLNLETIRKLEKR